VEWGKLEESLHLLSKTASEHHFSSFSQLRRAMLMFATNKNQGNTLYNFDTVECKRNTHFSMVFSACYAERRR
jgi:hypothetical protein